MTAGAREFELGPQLVSALGSRFQALRPHELATRPQPECHYAFAWRSAGAHEQTNSVATATCRHAMGFRFLHLCGAGTERTLPNDWLATCLAEAARYGQGETPAIVVIEASGPVEDLRRQVIAMGGTAIVPQIRDGDLPAGIVRGVEQALSGPEGAEVGLPLCLLIPAMAAETQWRNPA